MQLSKVFDFCSRIQYRTVPDKGRWEPGKGEKRRFRYIFVSSLSAIALCEGGSSFQKKRRIL